MSDNSFKSLLQISKQVKFAKFFLVFITIGTIYQLYERLGLNSVFGVIVIIVAVLFAFCFMMIEAFINFDDHKSKAKKSFHSYFYLHYPYYYNSYRFVSVL